MDEKKQLIKAMHLRMRRIIDKHTLIDEQPMRFDDDVVLSPREIRAVDLIGDKGSTNVTNIAGHFHFTKSAASQLVNKLVKIGFVDKRPSTRSNKEVSLSLTPKGVNARMAFQETMRGLLNDFHDRIHAFSMQQISTTAVMLEVMEDIVDERLQNTG
jgi:DNA-binding MarR family transcriptional regulator